MTLQAGHRYLIQSTALGKSISEIIVVEESDLAYKIQWSPDHVSWHLKKGFLEPPFKFTAPDYVLLEELSPLQPASKGQ